jgi:multiple sugar transport system permease protein
MATAEAAAPLDHAATQQAVRKPLKRRLTAIAIVCFLLVFFLWTVFPFVIMISTSFKDVKDAFQLPDFGHWGGMGRIFNFSPTLAHYRTLFNDDAFGTYMLHSVYASVGSAIASVVFGATAAYAISRGRFRGKKDLYFWIISTRMAPVVAVVVPLYYIFKNLHLLNSVPGLIIAYTTFNLPFAIWILKGFFDGIPFDIEEAQMCDGASRWGAFRSIVPLVAPGVAAVLVLCVLLGWNDFLFAAIMGGQEAKTLPVASQGLLSSTGIPWGELMAAGVITAAPMLLLGLVIRKYLISGLTFGAVRA